MNIKISTIAVVISLTFLSGCVAYAPAPYGPVAPYGGYYGGYGGGYGYGVAPVLPVPVFGWGWGGRGYGGFRHH